MREHTSRETSLEDFAPIAALLREEIEEVVANTSTVGAATPREDVEPTPRTEPADDIPDSIVEQWRQRRAAGQESS
ncbi:hypothetical protein GCM10010343_32970 [Streptomyces avidinii]|nr:hypothetical protein GCM10010343_32970 [Streptomyces avidinii]